jgi:catechol 2,3-dioxygenase-like lactoylglutathione lyase family enzyme
MPLAVDHIDVQVPDLEAFTRFMEALGFVEIRRTNPDRRQIELTLPGEHQIVFEVEQRDVPSLTVDHVALRCDDVQAEVDALRERGVEIPDDPRRANSGRIICNFRDAWGTKWQLTDDLDRDVSRQRSWTLTDR